MTKFLIFGVLGIFGQVVATAAASTISTRRITFDGRASLLLFPFWGAIAFLYPALALQTGDLPWYGRGAIYMAAFFIFQLPVGLLLKKLGICPWSYSGKTQLFGLVRLADAPAFFLAGLAIEWIYPTVKAAAVGLI
ncbi:MAG TPA: hypothetical protein PLZ86_04725 [bacterium]|nr:hypothetical protein [bacterium]